MFRKILIANDGSEGAFAALRGAIDMAARSEAELHMICIETISRIPATIDEVDEEIKEAEDRFVAVIDRSKRLAALKGVSLENSCSPGPSGAHDRRVRTNAELRSFGGRVHGPLRPL